MYFAYKCKGQKFVNLTADFSNMECAFIFGIWDFLTHDLTP